jgi:hypothetical protein
MTNGNTGRRIFSTLVARRDTQMDQDRFGKRRIALMDRLKAPPSGVLDEYPSKLSA